jgi:hypothetical protein
MSRGEPVKMKPCSTEKAVEILLGDYEERGEDYRRQVSYFPRIIFALLATITSSLGWVFGADDPNRYVWILPLVVVLCEIVAALSVYVYWSSELMHRYLLAIEAELNRVLGALEPLHRMGDGCRPGIVFGYRYWIRLNTRIHPPGWKRRFLRYFSALLVVACYLAILGSMWSWGIGHPVLSNRGYTVEILYGLLVAVPLIAVVLLFIVRKKIITGEAAAQIWSDADRASASEDTDRPELPMNAVMETLRIDYAERNRDFRTLVDNYSLYLTLTLSILAGAISLYLAGENSWVFAATPFLLVTIPFFMILTYRSAKPLRQYMARVESVLDESLKPTFPGIHIMPGARQKNARFRLGFIGITREQYWQQTTTDKPKIHNAVLAGVAIIGYLVLLAWMGASTHRWLVVDHPQSMHWFWTGAAAIIGVIVINTGLYLESRLVTDENHSTRS